MPIRTLIVGAGVGGLTLAIALARRGHPVEVVERAGELREIGAAVGLSANGTRVLARLGVADRLAQAAVPASGLVFRDGRTAARIVAHRGEDYRRRFGRSWWGIHRVDLQRALVETVETSGARLVLGRTVTAVTSGPDGAEVQLDDGTILGADVVVGADGVHSVVRDHVAGAGTGPRYTGTSGFRGLVARHALPSLPDPGALQMWVGEGAHVVHYPLGDGDTINVLAVVCGPDRWTDDARDVRPGELLGSFAGWHPVVLDMVAELPPGPRWPLLSQPALTSWTRGRVTLLGDACHAMLPHHGQGANQAIEDAATLAGLLSSTDPDSALVHYPRRRRARTRAITANSWETGTLLHLAPGPACERRDADLAHYLDRFAWVHDHDAAV